MLSLGKLLELTLADREPAQKTQMTVSGTCLRWLGPGALEVRPVVDLDNGLDLLLSAGIHGNETAPMELLDELIHAIARDQLRPCARVLFLFGNPEAIRRGERYLEQDINRLFNGRHERSSGFEALRACELERLAAGFFNKEGRRRLHYDLHTAIRGSRIEQFALYPWHENRRHSRDELVTLREAGMQAVLLQRKRGITFSAYTYETLGAEAFTLELGKARPFGQNASVNLSRLDACLRRLIEGRKPGSEERSLEGLALFTVSQEVIKHSDEFSLNLPADVENFSELPEGYVLAEDQGARFVIEEQGARIIFPNPKVQNGLRAGLVIVPCADAPGP